MLDFAALRQRMVDNQIRPGAVTDVDVIKAFQSVPRELFVAPGDVPFAYADRELPLPAAGGVRRSLMPPVQLARLIQALPRPPSAKMLIVGCGSGYSAALLARIAGEVVALEEDAGLIKQSRSALKPIANVTVVQGRLVAGHAAEAPYDAILVDGALEVLPQTLVEQLKNDGAIAAIERNDRTSRADAL